MTCARKLVTMKRTAALITAPLILMLGLTACDDNKGTITPAQSEAVATEEATDDTETATEEEAAADDAADEATEVASTNPTFGDTYTWPNGLAVTISAPEEITLSNDYMGELYNLEAGPLLAFTVTIHNGTDEDIESAMINTMMVSGSQESEAVYATDDGIDVPYSTILPGKDLTWKVAYVVSDPADLQLTVDNMLDFDSPKVHFTN